MKRSLPILFLFAVTFLFYFTAQAQITSFPYVEDFENPSVYQTAASCDATTSGAAYSGWTQDNSDDGEWRADSAGTPSVGTGPGATATTSGVGVGKDANPGTTSGTYLYTEGTSATSCASSNISLLSPLLDFSATGKYYRVKLNYHMFGAGMGSLHIDVNDNGTWYNDVWSGYGEADTSWQLAIANLANFNSDKIQIRIVAVMGSNYLTDCAIDNFVVEEYNPPLYDAVLLSSIYKPSEYPIMPLSQFDSISFDVEVKNEGVNNITKTEVEIKSGSFTTKAEFDTITPFEIKTGTSNDKYFPANSGTKTFYFETSIAESDTITNNNYDSLSLIVSDTVMARELGGVTGGIGFNTGTGEIGNMFQLKNADTITSVTFYIQTPTPGDSVRVNLRDFNTAPGNVVQSSPAIVLSSGVNWYTIKLNCPAVLSAGKYFAGVVQLTANSNMSLGYSTNFHTSNTSFYGNGTTWTAVETANFLMAALVRINLADVSVKITATSDSICPKGSVALTAKGGSSVSWSPAVVAFNPTASTTSLNLLNTTTMTVTANFGCGITKTASYQIVVKPTPSGTISKDTSICTGQSAVLKASGGSSYQWLNGPANTNWTVSPTASTTSYQVRIDSSNGCSLLLGTNVKISVPNINATADTIICQNESLTLTAGGLNNYQWLNGPATANYTLKPIADKTYYVAGFDSIGCAGIDSVMVTVKPAPSLTPMKDTGACFTQYVTLTAGGDADTYLWSTGATTKSINKQVLAAENVSLKAFGANGCTFYDTVFVERYLPPQGSIDPDTTICEGSEFILSAYGGTKYKWNTGDSTQSLTVTPKVQTKYSVTIYSDKGCTDFDEMTISLKPLAYSAFKVKTYLDSVVFTNQSLRADSIRWDFGDGSTSTENNPYHFYDTTGSYVVKLTAYNDCGGVDSSFKINVTVPIKTGIDNNLVQWGELKLYPIPSTDDLNYTLNNRLFGNLSITLTDAKGKIIEEVETIKSVQEFSGSIDISQYPSGIYFVKFSIENSSITKRAIKN